MQASTHNISRFFDFLDESLIGKLFHNNEREIYCKSNFMSGIWVSTELRPLIYKIHVSSKIYITGSSSKVTTLKGVNWIAENAIRNAWLKTFYSDLMNIFLKFSSTKSHLRHDYLVNVYKMLPYCYMYLLFFSKTYHQLMIAHNLLLHF